MGLIPAHTFQDLAAASLFAGISVNEIKALCAEADCSFLEFQEGAIVAWRGDSYERLILLTRGSLTAEIVDEKGASLKVESLVAPAPVASGILFAEEALLPVQLRAERSGEALSISRQGILDICRRDERFLQNYLRDGGNKIKFLADKLRFFRFNTIREKIAAYFLELSSRQGEVISLPYSLEVVADLFGVTRPALSRCLSQMVDEGLLGREGRSFRLFKREGLETLVNE